MSKESYLRGFYKAAERLTKKAEAEEDKGWTFGRGLRFAGQMGEGVVGGSLMGRALRGLSPSEMSDVKKIIAGNPSVQEYLRQQAGKRMARGTYKGQRFGKAVDKWLGKRVASANRIGRAVTGIAELGLAADAFRRANRLDKEIKGIA